MINKMNKKYCENCYNEFTLDQYSHPSDNLCRNCHDELVLAGAIITDKFYEDMVRRRKGIIDD